MIRRQQEFRWGAPGAAFATFIVVWASAPAAAAVPSAEDEVVRAGDTLQIGVPLMALGLTFLLGNDDGEAAGAGFNGAGLDTGWFQLRGSPRHELAVALARTEFVTYSLKFGVNEQRPNGAGQSFPSGHTSVAFAGAEFIRKEYGAAWAVPAYLAAGFVGWTRVASGAHWTHDVLAGAAIGIASNHDGFGLDFSWGDLRVAPTLLPVAGNGALLRLDESAPDSQPVTWMPALNVRLRF